MVRSIDDDRIAPQPVLAKGLEHDANRVVEPREARGEEPREARLLEVGLRVEPAAIEPRLRQRKRPLVRRGGQTRGCAFVVGRVGASFGQRVAAATMALTVVFAHEALGHEPAQHGVPARLPLGHERHVACRRARHVHLEGGGQAEGRVRHSASEEEEEWPRGRGASGRRAAYELDGLRGHPLRIVRALRGLLVAAPEARHLLKAAVRAHHADHVVV